jgi:hypothetical protein
MQYLLQHGYTQVTSYQPDSRYWTLQWIESGGWLPSFFSSSGLPSGSCADDQPEVQGRLDVFCARNHFREVGERVGGQWRRGTADRGWRDRR